MYFAGHSTSSWITGLNPAIQDGLFQPVWMGLIVENERANHKSKIQVQGLVEVLSRSAGMPGVGIQDPVWLRGAAAAGISGEAPGFRCDQEADPIQILELENYFAK
jgi:hypothetical protein